MLSKVSTSRKGSLCRWCMAVVSSCREVLGYVPQRAQPLSLVECSRETAGRNPEEGGDDVKSACPLYPGLHTRYNGRYNGFRHGDVKAIPKSRSQFGLQAATRLHEVGVASNRWSAHSGEYVPGPCTHRPSHHPSLVLPKSLAEPVRDGGAEGVPGEGGEVVTR